MKKQFWERFFQILDYILSHFGHHCSVPWHLQALLGIRLHKNCSQSTPQRVSFFAFERQGRPEKQNGSPRSRKSHQNDQTRSLESTSWKPNLRDMVETVGFSSLSFVASPGVATTLRQHTCDKLSEVISFRRVLELKASLPCRCQSTGQH